VDSLRDHLVSKTGLTPSAYRAAFTQRPDYTENIIPARRRR
jgi:predicted transcriptional regulator